MSISKKEVKELLESKVYVWETVNSVGGAFDGARCIIAQHESTKPSRYLICDNCWANGSDDDECGFEHYLIRRNVESERLYFCKHCDTHKQEQKVWSILHKQAVELMRGKLDLIADQLCNRIIDVLMIRLNIDESTREKVKETVKNIFDTIRLEEL